VKAHKAGLKGEKERAKEKLTGLPPASDPLAAARLEKLRIAMTRQISKHGWRLLAGALQAACEHGAMHQRASPQAALWQWRARVLRELAVRGAAPVQSSMPEGKTNQAVHRQSS